MKTNILVFYFFLISVFSIYTETIELQNGKQLQNVTIEKENDDHLIIKSEDGYLIHIEKSKVKNLDSMKDNNTSKKYSVTFTQYMWNDVPFRGISVLGERTSVRDNSPYRSFYQAWNLVNGLSFVTPDEHLSISMNVYSPTVHRINKDIDYRYQTAPGDSIDYKDKLIASANAKVFQPDYDPFAVKKRRERNGLKDIFDTSIMYKWNSKIGKITTGFYFANNVNYSPITLGELVVGIDFPFLEAINPSYTAYHRFTSEAGGGGNGSSNHRLSLSHTFLKDEWFNFTTALSSGYQYLNNQTDHKFGVSDITPRLQLNFGNIFMAVADMYRPDSRLYDNPTKNAIYPDTNKNDGKVNDPSKLHGSTNQFVVEQIGKGVDSLGMGGIETATVKQSLIQNYQQQKFMKHVIIVTFGYSIKF